MPFDLRNPLPLLASTRNVFRARQDVLARQSVFVH